MNARELAIEVKKRSDNNEGLRRIGVPLLYNPLGEIAAAKIQAQFSVAAPVYIRTGYDLEGLRRLLLLKVLSYRESIPKEGMQDFLDAHKAQLGNPYTGASMIWDPKSGYIFFTNMDGMKVHAVSL
jgi:hypothetical protein